MTEFQQFRPIEILLIEDDPGDTQLTREALDYSKMTNTLHCVVNGDDAISFVRRRSKYASAPRPDLILLDLNLPRRDGRDVLAEIKNDPDLRSIPIVVLTASQSEEDILRGRDLNADAYITKPVDFDRFVEVVRKFDEFFLTIVRVPQ